MYGFSYVGATQWLPATLKPPSLVAIAPAMTSSDYYDGWSYEGAAQGGLRGASRCKAWTAGRKQCPADRGLAGSVASS